MTKEKIRLVVADDHAILRQGLKRILEEEPDIEVVGEASSGLEAVALAAKLHPDIVIMDISMPGQNGIESTREIATKGGSKVLMLTVHSERQVIASAVTAGAAGYLLKDSLDNELITAVRTIHQGGSVFSTDVTKVLANLQPGEEQARRGLEALTPARRKSSTCLRRASHPAKSQDAVRQPKDDSHASPAHHGQAGTPDDRRADPVCNPGGAGERCLRLAASDRASGL